MIVCKPEVNISVLMPDGRTDHGVEPVLANKPLVRVVPQDGRDVFALQMLDHHREKWAPAHGPGIMVLPDVLGKILRPRF